MPSTPAVVRRKNYSLPGHDGHGYSDFRISSDDSDSETKSKLSPLKTANQIKNRVKNQETQQKSGIKPDRLAMLRRQSMEEKLNYSPRQKFCFDFLNCQKYLS